MQTYILFKSIVQTTRILDNVRLGRQREHALQILETIMYDDADLRGHPAVTMWREYPEALVMYGLLMCHEWRIVRGHSDSIWELFAKEAGKLGMAGDPRKLDLTPVVWPVWMQDENFIRSHRSNLIRKAPKLYGPEFPNTPKDMPYLWPQMIRGGEYRFRLSEIDAVRLENGERKLPKWLKWDEHKREVVKDG